MTKTGWIVAIIVLLAAAGIGFAAYVGIKGTTPEPETIPEILMVDPEAQANTGASVESVPGTETAITYTDTGFSPKSVEVATGSTVRFVNTSTHGMWVGVDDHPSHTKYDGTSTKEHCAEGVNTNGTFDSCVAMAPGTVYNFTFTKAGTFVYHNHTKSADTGTVIVK
jgi:plastocyanin